MNVGDLEGARHERRLTVAERECLERHRVPKGRQQPTACLAWDVRDWLRKLSVSLNERQEIT